MAELDTSAFADDVAAKLQQRGLSYHAAVAKWPELNVAMLSRACSEKTVSAANLLILCRYLGLDPFRYLIVKKQRRFTMKAVLNQAVTVAVSRENKRSE